MTAVDELTGKRVRVPKALVVFPYLSNDLRPSLGVTTGLAAYPTRVGAVVRGLREVLDRDNFYRNFLQMRPAVRLIDDAVGAGLEVAQAVGPRDDWLVFAYPEKRFGLPMVQAFFHDRVDGVMVRGTGSGLSWQAASRAAILEATQLLYQARKMVPDTVWSGYPAWSTPTVITELRDYLGSQPVDEPPAVAWERDEEQLSALLGRLAVVGMPVLVTAFRTPAHDWHVVRVLVPGTTTCQYSSDSAGGRALLNAPWRHGIPG
jgi:ribosomal protein S12 methylthiotransferase accessory factor YcaO